MAVIILESNAGRCSEMLSDKMTADFQHILDYSEIVIETICSSSLPTYTVVPIVAGIYTQVPSCTMIEYDRTIRVNATVFGK